MNVSAALAEAAAARPGAPALVDGDRVLSHGALTAAAVALAARLQADGVGPGRTLGLRHPNSFASAIAILAGLRTGAELLLLDPALKAAELEACCARAGCSRVLGAGRVAGLAVPQDDCPPVHVLLADAPDGPPGASPDPGALLLLSSGTTGAPKVVRRTAAQAAAAVRIFAAALPCGPGDRILAGLPFFHSFGLLFTFLGGLSAGAALYLDAFGPRSTAARIAAEGITVLPATPFMFRMLAETRFEPLPAFPALRLAVSAGSGLPPAVAAAFRARFGVGIHQSYGSTECGPVALGPPGELPPPPGWAGRPYPGVALEFGAPGPEDGGAERPIAVRSPACAGGYVGDPGASAEVFALGLVNTGDLGRLDERGDLHILGRLRPLLNVAGKKVSPAEVEACLKGHPRIGDAVVTAVPAPDGGSRIRATLVADPGLEVLEVQAYVAERLAAHKVPREILFASPGECTALGKVRHAPEGRP